MARKMATPPAPPLVRGHDYDAVWHQRNLEEYMDQLQGASQEVSKIPYTLQDAVSDALGESMTLPEATLDAFDDVRNPLDGGLLDDVAEACRLAIEALTAREEQLADMTAERDEYKKIDEGGMSAGRVLAAEVRAFCTVLNERLPDEARHPSQCWRFLRLIDALMAFERSEGGEGAAGGYLW
jgi:hypothetical protein